MAANQRNVLDLFEAIKIPGKGQPPQPRGQLLLSLDVMHHVLQLGETSRIGLVDPVPAEVGHANAWNVQSARDLEGGGRNIGDDALDLERTGERDLAGDAGLLIANAG